MKDYKEFLSDREIFVLEHHPAMSYRAIGEELGVTQERVRQIKVAAWRKVRAEKMREQLAERNKQPVTLTIRRKDLYIIARGLEAHLSNIHRVNADQRIKDTELKNDPDFDRATELLELFRAILLERRSLSELMDE